MRSLQSDHALEARGCHLEGAQVVPGKERRNHERFFATRRQRKLLCSARCGIGRARADGPGALQVYEAAQVHS